jgi:carboxypeptidase D
LYSGNDDSLLPHRGTESQLYGFRRLGPFKLKLSIATIQNTTFGGTQGFMKKPSTTWTDDSGNFAGIIHQERNWTYALFHGASHLVPQKVPEAAFTFFREFILGTNQTGFYSPESGSVVGGDDSALEGDFLPGNPGIFGGSISTTTTYTYPAATVTAWNAVVSSIVAEQAVVNTQQSAAPSSISRQGLGLLVSVLCGSLPFFLLF